MIRAVIFDMDGVLIDAKEWHYEALNRALDLFGMAISRHDHRTTFDGLPTSRKLEMLSLERGLPRRLHRFINEMKQRYTVELIHTLCKPNFAQEQALSTLKAKGYRTGVCSNSIRSTVRLMMEKAALAEYLDEILSNEDVKNAKPDPEMYVTMMSKLGLAPRECLIVEDNEHGIRAAKASGAHLLVVEAIDQTNIVNITKRIAEIGAPATSDTSKIARAA